ncbi:hypothetical protein [Thermoplasma sp.]|uniref:hypothetical protein n=1 Tax=Thermoplasma sp. TaxID=1973142 RepID=UPI0026237336|nr:hypothetical protein [Thermoplasma sp.]
MLKTLVYGLYPRSEKLRRSYNRWERGMIKTEDLSEIIREEKYAFYEMMERSGIEIYTDPLFNWYDILRPIVLSMENVKLGPLTRYLETNTFYRMPEFYGIPRIFKDLTKFEQLEENPPLPAYQLDRKSLLFLPSPYSLVRMSRLEADLREDVLLRSLVDEYIKIVKAFSGRKLVLFDVFDYGKHNISYLDPLLQSTGVILIARGIPKEQNLKGLKHKFEALVADGVDRDLLNYSDSLGIKAVSAHKTKIEGASIEKKMDDSVDLITHDDYMDFLPREIADIKVEVLGKMGDTA